MKLSNLRLISKNKLWFTFFIVKFVYLLFSWFILSKYLILGDTARYLSGLTVGVTNPFVDSTFMMDYVAHFFSVILGPFLANVPFLLLSFFGIYFPLKKLALNINQLLFVLFLLSLPSFGIWTSLASKESVTVFFLGVILGFLIDFSRKVHFKNKFILYLSIYLCLLFKPQYMIGLFSLFFYLFLRRYCFIKGFGQFSVFMLFLFLSFFVLFILRHEIDFLSTVIPAHFRADAASTRENIFWLEEFDIFKVAPYGMYISFFGPTFREASSSLIHSIVLFESYLFVALLFFAVFYRFLNDSFKGKFNVFIFSCLVIPLSWILFVHYPFGLFNPGSAIRYRSGFLGFITIIVFFVLNEKKYRVI